MRLLRFVKRAVLAIVVIAIIFVIGLSVYLRIEQYKFRRQAERLLSDVRELELKKASAEQVRVVVMKWGFKEWREEPDHPGHPCTEDNCLYHFEVVPMLAKVISGSLPFGNRRLAHSVAGIASDCCSRVGTDTKKDTHVCFIFGLDTGPRVRRKGAAQNAH